MLMRQFETRINQEAHQLPVTWWYRILPMRSYVKGWKIIAEPLPKSKPGEYLAGNAK